VDFIPPLKEFDFDGLRKLKPDEGSELLIEAGRAAYEAREAELNAQGPNLMRAVERFVTLQVVDNAWKEHLHNMDVLKQGIFLRGYGQRDPFQEYKLEGTRFFNEMIGGIKSEVTKFLFRLQVEVNQQPIPAPVAQGVEYSGSDAGAASPQGGFDPFTVRRQQKASTAFSGMSRAERRRLEREEKKKNKG
jgi:preprotein translocase subunit SecA